MSRENVELVMGMFEAFRRRDNDYAFRRYAQDIEWDSTELSLGPEEMQRVYRGHDGVRTFWRSWLASWEQIEFEVGRVADRGDQVVTEIARQTNRGRRSGAEVDMGGYSWIWTLDAGLVTRVRFRVTWEDALATAEAEAKPA